MTTEGTRNLFWGRAVGAATDEDVVAWALAEITVGPGTPSLAALATLRPPFNHLEAEDLLARALSELGSAEPDSAVSYREFLCETGLAIVEQRLTAREGCARLAGAHGGYIGRRELQPFWLLELGIHDLEGGGPQFYYDGLTSDNFDDLVRNEARLLVEKCGAVV